MHKFILTRGRSFWFILSLFSSLVSFHQEIYLLDHNFGPLLYHLLKSELNWMMAGLLLLFFQWRSQILFYGVKWHNPMVWMSNKCTEQSDWWWQGRGVNNTHIMELIQLFAFSPFNANVILFIIPTLFLVFNYSQVLISPFFIGALSFFLAAMMVVIMQL